MHRATRVILPFLATLLAAGAAAPAAAQDVTIGGPADHTNAFPFTGYEFQSPNRYQQVYDRSLFGGAVFIDAIRFSNTIATNAGLGGGFADGEYAVSLAISSLPVNGLSTDFDANVVDGTSRLFFSGTLGSDGLRIAGDPFLYDPALGDLLLDVSVFSQAIVGRLGFDASRSATDGTSRVFHTFPFPFTEFPVVADAFGLVTTFETRAVAVVPEPGSLLLVATGLGALLLAGRGRRRARGQPAP